MLCGSGGEKLLLLAEGLLKKHIATHSLHEPEGVNYEKISRGYDDRKIYCLRLHFFRSFDT